MVLIVRTFSLKNRINFTQSFMVNASYKKHKVSKFLNFKLHKSLGIN